MYAMNMADANAGCVAFRTTTLNLLRGTSNYTYVGRFGNAAITNIADWIALTDNTPTLSSVRRELMFCLLFCFILWLFCLSLTRWVNRLRQLAVCARMCPSVSTTSSSSQQRARSPTHSMKLWVRVFPIPSPTFTIRAGLSAAPQPQPQPPPRYCCRRQLCLWTRPAALCPRGCCHRPLCCRHCQLIFSILSTWGRHRQVWLHRILRLWQRPLLALCWCCLLLCYCKHI